MKEIFGWITFCLIMLTWHLNDSPLVWIPVAGLIVIVIVYAILESRNLQYLAGNMEEDDEDDDEEENNDDANILRF